MNNAPTYSVIIPAYNAETTIGECLEALSHQTLPREFYEVVVVDDGSTDNTAGIVQAFDVRYMFQENKGPAGARNNGAFSAKGDIILFIDSDCVPFPHWLEEMVKPFDRHDVDGVKGAYKTKQRSLTARFAQAEFEDRYALLQTHTYIDMVDTYSAAFKKSVFTEAGGFDENFPSANNEDTELSYRLASQGKRFVFNPDALVTHHHPDSLKQYLKIKFWRGYWRMAAYEKHPGKAMKDTYTPHIIKFQTLFMALSLAILPLGMFAQPLVTLTVLIWCLILLSACPFSAVAFKKDKTIGLVSPFYVLLRAFVFATGSVSGVASCIIKKRLGNK